MPPPLPEEDSEPAPMPAPELKEQGDGKGAKEREKPRGSLSRGVALLEASEASVSRPMPMHLLSRVTSSRGGAIVSLQPI